MYFHVSGQWCWRKSEGNDDIEIGQGFNTCGVITFDQGCNCRCGCGNGIGAKEW